MNNETHKHYSCALASTSGDILAAFKENARAPLCQAPIKHGSYTNPASEVHSLFVRLFVTDIQEFYIHGSVHLCSINKIQQDATVCRYLFTAKSLYMFRASIAPIVRST